MSPSNEIVRNTFKNRIPKFDVEIRSLFILSQDRPHSNYILDDTLSCYQGLLRKNIFLRVPDATMTFHTVVAFPLPMPLRLVIWKCFDSNRTGKYQVDTYNANKAIIIWKRKIQFLHKTVIQYLLK